MSYCNILKKDITILNFQLFNHLLRGTGIKVNSKFDGVLIRKNGFEYSTGQCIFTVYITMNVAI